MVHDGVCCLSTDELVKDDVSELISFLIYAVRMRGDRLPV